MDLALPELLNREDIINILNQRQLHVQNINELSIDELLGVYKRFVMPLSRRPERSKRAKQFSYYIPAERNEVNEEYSMQTEFSDSSSNAMDIDFLSVGINSDEEFRAKDRVASPAGEKRRQRCSEEDIFDMLKNDYQYQLSSVTKRIRINSLS